jgi:hypothetical protein
MNFASIVLLLSAGLLCGIIICLEIGRRIGRGALQGDAEGFHKGFSAIEGSVFGMLGLLIAFTFSGAASRYDHRRQLIAEEANKIGTAYMRIDLLPEEAQPGMRNLFRSYLEARLESYDDVEDTTAVNAMLDSSAHLQGLIWKKTLVACEGMGVSEQDKVLLLTALNEMIDITTTRKAAIQTHPPVIVFIMLILISLFASLLAGYGMAASRKPGILHILAFAVLLTFTVYVILELEYPRKGLIRLNAADKALLDLQESMQ